MEFGHSALEFAYASRRASAVNELHDIAASIGKLFDGFLVHAVQDRHAAGELVKHGQWEDGRAFRPSAREPFFVRCAFNHKASVLGETFGTSKAAPRQGRNIVPKGVVFETSLRL